MECILKELVARVQQADQDENLQKAAKTATWTNSEKAWLYKRWDPQSKTLVATDKAPLTTTELLQTLEELLQDVRMSDGLRKFQASRPLDTGVGKSSHGPGGLLQHTSGATWGCGPTNASKPQQAMQQYGAETPEKSYPTGTQSARRHGKTGGGDAVWVATKLKLLNLRASGSVRRPRGGQIAKA